MPITAERILIHELRQGDMLVRLQIREGIVEFCDIVALPLAGSVRGNIRVNRIELNDLNAVLDEIQLRGL